MSLRFFVTLALSLALLIPGPAGAQSVLRIGLNDDPDALDPTISRAYTGRLVFAAVCDKLFDTTADLKIVPQLATSFEWAPDQRSVVLKLRSGVKFHDGEPFNGEAVKFNIERHINTAGSFRKPEIGQITSVDVLNETTVRLNLSEPLVPLLAALTDRSGMMVSPKAAEAAGDKFGAKPVCSGPFRFVERIAQDRITLERFPNYWNKAQIHFERIVYQPIPDATVRLANLRSGQLDFIERVAPSDIPQLRSDSRFRIAKIVEIGYQGITINVGKSDFAQKNPLGKDARVREAFELSIDREALVKVAMEGEAQAGNQWVAPSNRYYTKSVPVPKRNVERAKQLLREAGVTNPSFTLMTPTASDAQRMAQVIQAMAKDAGFDVKIQSTEFATALKLSDQGQYEAFLLAWSGRADPDGNLHIFLACKGPLNNAGWCKPEADEAIEKARVTLDPAQRARLYETVAQHVSKDRPIIYLFHRNWLWAHNAKLTGLRTVPDGMVRVQGLKM